MITIRNYARIIGLVMMWSSIICMAFISLFANDTLYPPENIRIISLLLLIILVISQSYTNAKIKDIYDNHFVICAGLGGHIKYRINYHEILNVKVKYGWYDADLIINFKHINTTAEKKSVKFNIVDRNPFFYFRIPVFQSPFKRVEDWLFPLLDKLYNKCQLIVLQKKNLANYVERKTLKKWHPPGSTYQNDQAKDAFNKKVIIYYVMYGIKIAVILTLIIISILRSL